MYTAVAPPTFEGSRGKPATRRTLLSCRDGLTVEDRASASVRIAQRTTGEVVAGLSATSVIALYSAKGSEVETQLIDVAARARGLRVVYPRVAGTERVLAFHEVERSNLAASRFGLREPGADTKAVALAEISVFLVPGLAFDREGGRIGWGRGHYDATFAARPEALRVGLAYECQIVERVPRESHDMLVNIIITEVATHVVA